MTSELESLKAQLAPLYNASRRWSYEEECLLLLLIRVPNYQAEVHQVIEYWNSLPSHAKSFFPQSMSRLLTDWTGVLDKAAVSRRKVDEAPAVTAAQKILWSKELTRIEARMKSLKGQNGDQPWPEEHREEFRKLKARKTELIGLLGFAV